MSASGEVLNRGAFLSHEKDYNHASDKQYTILRKQAEQAYSKRNKLSSESQAAYKRGDKARAHELSTQAKQALQAAENFNSQAAEYVFVENNADSDSNEIDLHGLYVKEAVYILKQRIMAGISRHESKLEVIVGKGLHSAHGVAKLKPAIEELCQESNLRSHIDKHNTGVLVIDLQSAQIPAGWTQSGNSIFTTPGKPQAAYQYQNQPQYQQQQQQQQQQPYQQNNYNQQQQYAGTNNNNGLAGILIKLLCACLNSK